MPAYFDVPNDDALLNLGSGYGAQNVVFGPLVKHIVCVDIAKHRHLEARTNEARFGVRHCAYVVADACRLPLKKNACAKAIACDVIEHVDNVPAFLAEAQRAMKPGGKLLLTVPALHEFYKDVSGFFGDILRALKILKPTETTHADLHNQVHSMQEWLRLVREAGFEVEDARASTMFPPLHWFGVPRFWSSNKWVRAVDDFFCRLPGFKWLGQAAVFELKAAQSQVGKLAGVVVNAKPQKPNEFKANAQ